MSMLRSLVSLFLVFFLPNLAIAAIKICEFNDPVSGTTANCSRYSAAGGGYTLVDGTEKFGDFLVFVEKTSDPFIGGCSLSYSGATSDYYVTGTCSNYSIYENNANHSLTVRYHTSVSGVTNTVVDSIMSNMNNIMQVDNGAYDEPCAISFSRNGSVSSYSTGDGSIDSESEIMALPIDIYHIVDEINWCGGLNPLIVGCSWNARQLVERFPSAEGALWAHEYGHRRGLGHRDEHDAIMRSTISSSRDEVNWDECNTFK